MVGHEVSPEAWLEPIAAKAGRRRVLNAFGAIDVPDKRVRYWEYRTARYRGGFVAIHRRGAGWYTVVGVLVPKPLRGHGLQIRGRDAAIWSMIREDGKGADVCTHCSSHNYHSLVNIVDSGFEPYDAYAVGGTVFLYFSKYYEGPK